MFILVKVDIVIRVEALIIQRHDDASNKHFALQNHFPQNYLT